MPRPIHPTLFSRSVMHDLINQPLATMGEFCIATITQPNLVSHQSPLYINVNQGNGFITFADYPAYFIVDPRTIRSIGISSPMQTPVSPHRLTVMPRFNAAGNRFWITDTQTGCSVLILDWGAGSISMAHLQPHDDASFNFIGRTINYFDFSKAIAKNLWLRRDLQFSTQSTVLAAAPAYP